MTVADTLADLDRSAKPREVGITSVIDTGLGVRFIEDHLAGCADYVDLVKLGFGTGILTSNLADKLSMYRGFGIDLCFGGTLFEYFFLRDELDVYKRLLDEFGVSTVEISDGTVDIPADRKLALIAEFAADFLVLSEVGSKDASVVVAPAKWVRSIRDELDAGARRVILEGRESGTAGMYRTTGEMRTGLVEEVLDAGFDPRTLVFEAPQKDHQSYLIRLIGPEVNLANIGLVDILPCEALRRGLRSDTLLDVHASR